MVRGGAQPALLLQVVHLHHHAVRVVAQAVALGLHASAVIEDPIEVRHALRARVHPEAARAERLEPLPLRVKAGGLQHAHVVEEDLERPGRGDRGVLLPDRPRRRVARVGEDRLSRLLEPRVEPGERLARHVDLAAHLETRRVLQRAGEPGRDRLDRAQVLGDILADAPVAPGRAPHEPAPLVEQRHPEPVDLGLAHVGGDDAGQRTLEAGLELDQVLRGGRVVERQHRDQVLDRREQLVTRSSRPLGGALGRDQLGMRGLQLDQLAPEPVVLGVADLGSVLGVVEIVVAVDLLPQGFDPGDHVGRGRHRGSQDSNRAHPAPSGATHSGCGGARLGRVTGTPAPSAPGPPAAAGVVLAGSTARAPG